MKDLTDEHIPVFKRTYGVFVKSLKHFEIPILKFKTSAHV